MADDSLASKTLRVLQEVAAHERGIGLSELSRHACIPKATCYRILQVLQEDEWLQLNPDTRRYRVTFKVFSLVGGLLDKGMYPAVRSVLTSLTEHAKETSGFDLLMPPVIKVLMQVPGPALIGQTPSPVPRNQSVWNTASGKAALALLSRDQIEELFQRDFLENVAPGAPSFERYLDSFAAVRERGYAVAIDELEPGASAVATSVKSPSGLPYAVWIGGPSYRLTRTRIEEELGELTIRAAAELEKFVALDAGGMLTGP